jgi:hypothetical protein
MTPTSRVEGPSAARLLVDGLLLLACAMRLGNFHRSFLLLGRICLFLAAPVLVPGCRSAHQTSLAPFAGPSDSATTSRSSDVLDRVEIESVRVNNAHEALVRLRPEFLRRRGASAASDPNGGLATVYLDGVRQGGPDMLFSIPAGAILDIRYVSAIAAGGAFGPYHRGGVISVRTKR